MKHTISILVENQFGVLARIAGMFSGRGFNIDTLNVAPIRNSKLSRLTATVNGDNEQLDQATKQLKKLVNVIEVIDFKEDQYVSRELVMVKIQTNHDNRSDVVQICDLFRARVVNVTRTNIIAELTGDDEKLTAFLNLLDEFGIIEMARTGNLALKR